MFHKRIFRTLSLLLLAAFFAGQASAASVSHSTHIKHCFIRFNRVSAYQGGDAPNAIDQPQIIIEYYVP
jgi:hypothetical protein